MRRTAERSVYGVSLLIERHYLFNTRNLTRFMTTILLLILSNTFMTTAWYWHLKADTVPLWKVILISWSLALVEYCLAVPANRIGFERGWNGFQLKIAQEAITIVIFSLFAVFYLKESLEWKYAVSFVFILGAVYFAFRK